MPFSSPNRAAGAVLGAASLALGVLGFSASAAVGFASPTEAVVFWVLSVNALQSAVHFGAGAVLLFGAVRGVRAAKAINSWVGLFYLAFGIAGLFLTGTPQDIFALNVPDHVIHFAASVLLLGIGVGADNGTTPPHGRTVL